MIVRRRSRVRSPSVPARMLVAAILAAPCSMSIASGYGVSAWLPLQLSPELEQRVEQLLVLAGEPVLVRPVAVATVMRALPAACEIDAVLCDEVRRHMAGYSRTSALNHVAASVGGQSGSRTALPGRHGMDSGSTHELSLGAYWRPADALLLGAGALAYRGEVVPVGTVISVGRDQLQLDLGFRDRWWSPLTDSAMLVSTQAATMPSLTVSNHVPLAFLGLRYEVFVARMGRSDRIVFDDRFTSGRPLLGGVHLSLQPFPGWSIGFSRLMQFGGGERGGQSLKDVARALVSPSRYDNRSGDGLTVDEEFGNQAASITTRLLLPGPVPIAVYFEYAGEDTSAQSDIRLGNAALSAGVHFARLGQRFQFVLEMSEWQNAWYVHSIYTDGLAHQGNVLGHWGADYRVTGDGTGARSFSARLEHRLSSRGSLTTVYRTLRNQSYTEPQYVRAQLLELRYSRSWQRGVAGAELHVGRNVFGERFGRAGLFARF